MTGKSDFFEGVPRWFGSPISGPAVANLWAGWVIEDDATYRKDNEFISFTDLAMLLIQETLEDR